jgi:hypothetical protein
VSVDPKRSGNAMRLCATLTNIDDSVVKENKQDLSVKQLDSSKVELYIDDNAQIFNDIVKKFVSVVQPIVEQTIAKETKAAAYLEIGINVR